MFTGLIEEVGEVRSVERLTEGLRLVIGAAVVTDGLAPGDSLAVDGVCLTAVACGAGEVAVEAVGTTLSRSTLAEASPGRRVNLERALALGERLGGHLVQGHVDGTGEVLALRRTGDHVLLDVRLPEVVAEVTVLHGSIAINGVSMTVNALPAGRVAQVAVVPYTWGRTNLGELRAGDPVNLEGDLLGRFVVHYLKQTGPGRV